VTKQERVRAYLVDRIRHGTFPVGGKLPGIRALARRLDTHPNTVAQVIRELGDEGVVRSEQGRGTFVLTAPTMPEALDAALDVRSSLRALAARARDLGLSPEQFARWSLEAVTAAAQDAPLRMRFVECNPFDTRELADHIGHLLRRRVEPLLLKDLLDHPEGAVEGTDLFITTPFHIEEVEPLLRHPDQAVSVLVTPTASTLVELSRIDRDARVAAVATNERTLERLVWMIKMHARMEPQVQCLIHDPHLETRLDGADVIVGTHSIQDDMAALAPEAGRLTVHYQLEASSASYLVERVADLFPPRPGAAA